MWRPTTEFLGREEALAMAFGITFDFPAGIAAFRPHFPELGEAEGLGEHRNDQVGLPRPVRLSGMKLVYVLARNRRHFQMPGAGPKVALHDFLHPVLGARPVLAFHMFDDIAVKKVIDVRRRSEASRSPEGSRPSTTTVCRTRCALARAASAVTLPCSPIVNHRERPCLLR